MEWTKEVLADLILIGMAIFILFNLCLIAIRGVVLIGEPNRFILYAEIALTVIIIILAVERLLTDI